MLPNLNLTSNKIYPDLTLVLPSSSFSVLRRMRRREPCMIHFHQYLIVLAIVDSFLIIMFVIDDVIVGQLKSGEWFFTVVPYVTHPVKCISITMSMMWVVILAIKRFLAVTRPLINYSNGNSCICIIFMVIFSATVNLSK